jgi:hypothetical protein
VLLLLLLLLLLMLMLSIGCMRTAVSACTCAFLNLGSNPLAIFIHSVWKTLKKVLKGL